MGKSGVCLRERGPEESFCLGRKKSVRSAFEQRADLYGSHGEKNMGNQQAERCLHIRYTKYRAFYVGSE